HMIEQLGTARLQPQLFSGALEIGFTLHHLGDDDAVAAVCGRCDEIARAGVSGPTWQYVYDLCHGLVGIGVYAVERGDRTLAVRVLDQLDRLAERDRDGEIAWLTRPELLIDWQLAQAPHGYYNLGVAHGMPGIMALAARYSDADIERDRARAIIMGLV